MIQKKCNDFQRCDFFGFPEYFNILFCKLFLYGSPYLRTFSVGDIALNSQVIIMIGL